jgi:hypothetical protein
LVHLSAGLSASWRGQRRRSGEAASSSGRYRTDIETNRKSGHEQNRSAQLRTNTYKLDTSLTQREAWLGEAFEKENDFKG